MNQIWTRGKFYTTKLTASDIEDIVTSSSSIESFIAELIAESTNGIVLDNDGNGMKFLSNDGTYKSMTTKVSEIENDLSYVTSSEVNNMISELTSKVSELESRLNQLVES